MRLILVKHSLPNVIPGVSPEQWLLGEEGRRRCRPLAEKLAAYHPTMIVASREPKAMETAELTAVHLNLPWTTAEGLHEQQRHNIPFFGNEAWQATMAAFFARPEELILGQETAVQAQARFTTAVKSIAAQYPEDNLVLVTHGTVMSLFTAVAAVVEPFPLWQQLGLPSFILFSRPDFTLLEIVNEIL